MTKTPAPRKRAAWIAAGALMILVAALPYYGCARRADGARPGGGTAPPSGPACMIVTPKDQRTLPPGPIELIVNTASGRSRSMEPPALQVNGEAQPWDPAFSGPVLAATLELPPGQHTITVGEQEMRIAVGSFETARQLGWPVLRRHPGQSASPSDCAACHKTTERGGTHAVGALRPRGGCIQCHEEKELEKDHAHPMRPLRNCSMCHDMHAAGHGHLLKSSGREFCTSCHD